VLVWDPLSHVSDFYIDVNGYIVTRNASNTHSNTHFSTHSFWLVEIYMGSTKFIWDPCEF